tara:strand:- start:59 stop:412 length:354 start_codon:yes stop_codon:yes gene_type:complete
VATSKLTVDGGTVPVIVVFSTALSSARAGVLEVPFSVFVPVIVCTADSVDAVPTTPAAGNPVAFVSVPEAGVPSAGVIKVGEVLNTATPDPVSLVSAVISCAEVNEPSTAALPDEVM